MPRTPFSDLLVLAVKDQLRNVRYHIRRNAHGEASRENWVAPRAPRPFALAADAVFSHVEAAAAALLPEHERKAAGANFPRPVTAYLGERNGDSHPFTPEIYYALKALLRRFGADEFLVSEQAVEEAHGRLAVRKGGVSAASLNEKTPTPERTAAVTRLCAALAVEIAAARPIKELALGADTQATPRHLETEPNVFCALAIGLAVALASLAGGDEPANLEVVIGSANMAVDARFDALSTALKSRTPVESLAGEFQAMLPFLP